MPSHRTCSNPDDCVERRSRAGRAPVAVRGALLLVLALLGGSPARADRITEVRLDGLTGELAKNARQYLAIEGTRAREQERSESYLRYQLEEGVEEIRAALEPFGHYQPTIEASLAAAEEAGTWRAVYRVEPGPQVRFGTIDVDLGAAAEDPEVRSALPSILPLEAQPFTHLAYEGAKKQLLGVLARLGYFENELTANRVVVDVEAGTANVVLAFASGPRYRFGPTRFEGSQFDDDFMARFGTLPEGEPYRDKELIELQRNLARVEYFREAHVQPLVAEAGEEHAVPVLVTVLPNLRQRYTAGVNFGTDSGVGVQGTARWRWINRHAHAVNAELEYGTRNRRLIGGYRLPGRALATSYGLSGGYGFLDTDAYVYELLFLSGERTHRWREWDLAESISINDEQFEVGGVDDERFYLLGELTAERSVYDDRMFTRRGWQLRGALRGTQEAALSDFNLLQFEARGAWIRSFGERNRLLLRGRFGVTQTDDVADIPASLRFFAGGDRSVRGFDFESLGPRNEDGEVIGGAHVIVGSATFEHYFREQWGIAGFVDAGNAFDGDVFTPVYGVGLGLRWVSPIGLVRVDVAVGQEEDQDDQEFRIHLNIGPDL